MFPRLSSAHDRRVLSHSLPIPMAAIDEVDEDKLTPEEREAKDKADRAREAEEQAGQCISLRSRPFATEIR